MEENSCICCLKILKSNSNLMVSEFDVSIVETILSSAGVKSQDFHLKVYLSWSNAMNRP